jgi:hypothetical protein
VLEGAPLTVSQRQRLRLHNDWVPARCDGYVRQWCVQEADWMSRADCRSASVAGISPINICPMGCLKGPPLWSSGQSSWLQIQRSQVLFLRYQIFWEVVGLKRGPLSLMSTIEALLGRISSGSGLESRDNCLRDPPRWPCDISLSAKVWH